MALSRRTANELWTRVDPFYPLLAPPVASASISGAIFTFVLGVFAMPKPSWVPLPHEADLFHEVYIDESSQTQHRYLLLGGLCVPLSHSAAFEADIIAHRDNIIPITRPDGTPRIIKWEKANAYNLAAYKRVIDAYFSFPMRHKMPLSKSLEVHCLAVDTSRKTLKNTGEGDVEIGFAKEFYFLCVPLIGGRFKKALFHLYPDRRTTKQSLLEARNIMNAGARKYRGRTDWPYRELAFQDPESKQALQVVDIIIGAIAFRLNGHYAKPEAKKAKKELCDYILARARIIDPHKTTPFHIKRITIMHRDGTARQKRK